MIFYPPVVVHGLDEAQAALAPGLGVTLLSATGAAALGGCAWWRALIDLARATHPTTPADDIIDCDDAPGLAMAALRMGQRQIVLSPQSPAFAAVVGAAAACGARVLSVRPQALDLGQRGSTRRLRHWLESGGF